MKNKLTRSEKRSAKPCSQAKVVKVWHSVRGHYHANAFGRVQTYYLNPRSVKEMYSGYDSTFKYSLGKIVRPRYGFDDNPSNVCSRGIHYFDTYAEAVAYPL